MAPTLPITLAGSQSQTTPPWSIAEPQSTSCRTRSADNLDWYQELGSIELSENLAAVEARVVVLSASVGSFPAVRLAFGWAKTDSISVLLGQVNFFMEFDVCFFRSRSQFEVRPKG